MSDDSIAAGRPLSFTVSLAVVGVTALAFMAWLLIGMGAILNPNLDDHWVYTGLALPGATLGAIAAQVRGRRAYLLIGFAITLIPLIAFVVLNAVTPPPPYRWTMD